ncbi:CDP-alcohol phosphatidyltransferase family protein [Sphingobacterium spiritivorum]|uniref:CDP-alcohol phosphatidyltransferase n=1 Tax=Sphingobacterium spiritivorum ATCC 33861 TaxID=525373 RepID=D7VIP1_SPHSI|nr:CDP-alcohol phosphatidyltransferase family protein [Sphingobacterium spiritivorum]EFK59943.1 CDP-alcohol phosphatidyltransferase [Sphingobacterium spiritivorum ATCC 33861]QQT37422.1 CDP-alcohol phosphatidyltransferase family protein [Sphingobacterium spiritivorum]WQD34216.1 CDP-alcohol phosphatidyltransferase family protein [Sphingobacterium spiritivorum]SUI97039.1 CDP-diacylglycerol--glycerol-3-phosphate 3-phosphatidyltransferase [Sphingobacterium spiritivorum]
MDTKKENIWNVPNALSIYRILALPFIIYAIYVGDKPLFITLLSINLITDILDGLIARVFRLQTEFGARLDSLADIGTYIMAFAGMIMLEKSFVMEHRIEFSLLIGMWLLPQLVSLIRFRRFPSFHLWSYKVTGYVQGIFIFTFFIFGVSTIYFYIMLVISLLAYMEELLLVSILPKLRSNVKSSLFVWNKSKE